jgi:dihydroxy-acid dehydratase
MISSRVKDGLTKSEARALFKGAGFTDEEIRRPFIGVANSWTNYFPGHNHLDKLGQAVMDGIHMAGGTPMAFHTIAVCDGISMGTHGMKFSLPSRELIANSVESIAEANGLDALVLVASCDKIIPGMLMGALRVNIPTIIVTGGPMLQGKFQGKAIKIRSASELPGTLIMGNYAPEDYHLLEDEYCSGCGSCEGMFTANSMACMTEILGLGIPGNGTVAAVKAKRTRMAKEAGMRIMALCENNIKPSDIVTKKSIENAIVLDMMLGCSTNTVLHLPAIARELGIKVGLSDFDRISRITPQIVKLNPASDYVMEDLDDAGGVSAVIRLGIEGGLIDADQASITGRTIGGNVAAAQVFDHDVIRSLDAPYSEAGGLRIIKGNIAPLGAVIKTGGIDPRMLHHIGKARVFDSESEGMAALLADQINKGDVMVIRYEGPKGGPGMQEMLTITAYISGTNRDADIALITDGRFSGASRGALIGHIAPEAALGGPIALIEEGDLIEIDLTNRSLNLKIDEEELERRRNNWRCPPPKVTRGWLAQYAKLVGPVSEGAPLIVE